jgi:gp45 sliding clamp, C terminal
MFRPGNIIRVISQSKTIIGKAQIPQAIDKTFCIFDLNRFLSIVSSLDNPSIEIKYNDDGSNGSAIITSGATKIVYRLTDEAMIVAAPDKDLKLDKPEITFNMKKDALSQVLKGAGILGLPNLVISGDRSKIRFSTADVKNDGSDSYAVEVGETSADFNFIFNVGNFKMLPLDYAVTITSKGFAQFTAPNIDYWVAMEKGSRFEA